MKKSKFIFTLFFLFIIFALPVSQAIYEVTSGKRIQVLDLIEDTFLTPVKRAAIERASLPASARGSIRSPPKLRPLPRIPPVRGIPSGSRPDRRSHG